MFGRQCCGPDCSANEQEGSHVDAPIMVDGEAPIDWTKTPMPTKHHPRALGVTASQPVVGSSLVEAMLTPPSPVAEDLAFSKLEAHLGKVVDPDEDVEDITSDVEDLTSMEQPEEEPPESGCRRESGLLVVTLAKDKGKKVGIDVNQFTDSEAIPVLGINGGLAQEWNDANPKDAIQVGDVIVEVNGIKGDACQMLATCRDEMTLTFTIVRRSVYEAPI